MYPLETWFVSGICVWLPCIKETTMVIIINRLHFTGEITLHVAQTINSEQAQHYSYIP